jgi:hypothetical protein
MSLVTDACHQHRCAACDRNWNHAGYSCAATGGWVCPECQAAAGAAGEERV